MSTSIFTFDHGQKKLNKAIGVNEEYLDDLSSKSRDLVVSLVFTDNKEMNEEYSPSQLVEACLSEFSYSQLVILASLHLQERVSEALHKMEKSISKASMSIKTVGINGDDLPQELKDFLDKLIKQQEKDDNDE
jgi:hypothetical protein